MIAFDNGPADGDYVRYIETMAQSAAKTVADAAAAAPAPTAMGAGVAGTTGFAATSTQARMREVATRRATATPAAVAKAMALQSAAGRIALPALGRALSLMLAGALLVVIGLAMQPTSVIALLFGLVVGVVGFRQATNAVAALRDRAGTRSP